MTISVGQTEIQLERKEQMEATKLKISNFLSYILAMIIALVITAIIVLLSGKDPVVAFISLITGAFGSWGSFSESLVRGIPYVLAGLGLTVCYRTGLVSIGAEGQMIMGGLTATVFGVYLAFLPRVILLPLTLIASMAVGGLWSAIAGYFKAKKGVSEVIISIMLNYIASYLLLYLLDGPMREPPGYYPQSSLLSDKAMLSVLFPNTRLHSGFILALVSAVVVYFLLWKLPLGYQMRAVGYNAKTARTSGINVKKNLVLAMFLSGIFAGLAGAVEITGLHQRLLHGFSAEMGFDAIAVALLGGLHPLGVTVAGFLFGALRVGANMMQRTVQVPASLVNVILGMTILLILAQRVLTTLTIKIVSPRKREQLPCDCEEEA